MTVPLSLHLGFGGAKAEVTSTSPPSTGRGGRVCGCGARCSPARAGRTAPSLCSAGRLLFLNLPQFVNWKNSRLEEQVCQGGNPGLRVGPGGRENRRGHGAVCRAQAWWPRSHSQGCRPPRRAPASADGAHHPFRKPPLLPRRPGSLPGRPHGWGGPRGPAGCRRVR